MSDAVAMALIVGVPAMLTSLAAAILSLRNGFKADSAAVAAESANVLAKDTNHMVNSQREEMLKKIATLQAEIVALVKSSSLTDHERLRAEDVLKTTTPPVINPKPPEPDKKE